jgi:Secretion system C-terminal sorting domain
MIMKKQYKISLRFLAVVAALCCAWHTQAQVNINMPCAFSQTITGAISASSPTQNHRMFRDGISTVCGTAKGCPGSFNAGTIAYEPITITNTSGMSRCVTVSYALTSGPDVIFSSAYLSSYVSGDFCTNYLADGGSSSTGPGAPVSYSFDLPPGQMVVIVMNERVAGTIGDAYSVTVSATGAAGVGGTNGTTSGGTTVCSVNNGALTLSGHTGTPTGWQASTNGFATFSAVGNASATLAYTNLTTTTQFRAVFADCKTSLPATITVSNPNSPALVKSGSGVVCRGANSGMVSLGGYPGVIEAWVYSTDGFVTGINIATSESSIPYNNISQETRYRAIVVNGSCRVAHEVATITVTDIIAPTVVNVGNSQRRTLATAAPTLSSWPTAGPAAGSPSLDRSTPSNRSKFFVEDYPQPRFWTIEAKICSPGVLANTRSLSYLLYQLNESTETFVRSYNTVENNAPYFMFGNDGYQTLYTINDPAFGFSSFYDNLSMGLPTGKYNLKIKAMSMPGAEYGTHPSNTTRNEAGAVLLSKDFYFQITPRTGGSETARIGNNGNSTDSHDGSSPLAVASVSPNPAKDILSIQIEKLANQNVSLDFMDINGRTLIQRNIKPLSNAHTETMNISQQNVGTYILRVVSGSRKQSIKVIKNE